MLIDVKERKKMKGTVKFWNVKGYGFIQSNNHEKEVFVHYSGIKTKDKFKSLKQGNKVKFEIFVQKDGREKAINVLKIK